MGYNQCWKWETAIADASRFTAWSRDIAYMRAYMASPDKLLPWEVSGWLTILESGKIELLRESAAHLKALGRATVFMSEPQPFPPVIIRGPDGTGEPIITPTEVAFNGDDSTNNACEPFEITFRHLRAPHEGWCKTNQCSYDVLVRCALVRLTHHFPTVRVYSDGGKPGMEMAVSMCRHMFADETTFPLWDGDDDNESV